MLCISGHDPTGGAGLQADIETVSALGGRPLGLITALTRQDSTGAQEFEPVDATRLLEQGRCLLDDLPVTVVKIGMLGSEAVLHTVVQLLQEYPGKKVVVDPVLSAGEGASLSAAGLGQSIKRELLPLAHLVTPNTLELVRLADGEERLDLAAGHLIAAGCEYVLVTGTHAPEEQVIHRLYDGSGLVEACAWPRLSGSYHGSGCTLASALAVELAKGRTIRAACNTAQQYTMKTLLAGYKPGRGQYFPDRFCAWSNDQGQGGSE